MSTYREAGRGACAALPVAEVVRQSLAKVNPDAEAANSTDDSLSALNLSSLEMVAVVMHVEDHYGIQFDEDRLAFCDTVGEFCAYVEEELSSRR